MTNKEALLDEIHANPDDLGARLIYADWLEEHGDPLGEFIRVQCELATVDPFDGRRIELASHARDLLSQHKNQWLSQAREYQSIANLKFHCGFVEEFTLGFQFENYVLDLLEAFPLARRLHFRYRPHQFRDLDSPLARRISDCFIYDSVDTYLSALANMRHATNLRSLNLRGAPVDKKQFNKSIIQANFQNLARIDIQRGYLSTENFNAIVRSRDDSLDHLILRGNDIHSDMMSLVQADFAPYLQTLDMSQNKIGSRGVRNLAKTDRLPQLKSLRLSRCELDAKAIDALVASEWFANVESLDLSENKLNQPDLEPLLTTERISNLRALDLNHNRATTSQIQQLASSPSFQKVAFLGLASNRIGDDGAIALAKTTQLRSLRSLDLTRNELTDRAALALAESSNMSQVHSLRLGYNKFSPGVVLELVRSPHFSNLHSLVLRGTELDETTRRKLIERFGDRVWM